jgi:hypothetical protein
MLYDITSMLNDIAFVSNGRTKVLYVLSIGTVFFIIN